MAIFLIFAIMPAMGAQSDENYNVSAKKALEQADSHVAYFSAIDALEFEDWKGADIDSQPVEFYDIDGKKLHYLFSVYDGRQLIGRIEVNANKTLGYPVQAFEFDPTPFDQNEAMEKSIKIANDKYPAGDIQSTKMVVYSYPKYGAMSLVIDKTTGDKHRVIVDAYSLELMPDKRATEKEPGIWSVYDSISEDVVGENVAKWEEGVEIVQAMEEPFFGMQESLSAPYKKLSVPLYGQEESYYCAPATAQMIAKYYGVTHAQADIIAIMGGDENGCSDSEQLTYYKASNGLDKDGSYIDSSPTFNEVVSEIDNNRPLKSGVSNHARVCTGYRTTVYGLQYIFINDPWPVGYGMSREELWDGGVEDHINVKD
ncbi:C39 family peptidase [Methanococcoides methylutens]|jgi:hypothetical protein|uniref:C39 family peptidase n=1 Tax=Methanococcoides methylutens TaxID=2226 RepID=UPI0040446B9F